MKKRVRYLLHCSGHRLRLDARIALAAGDTDRAATIMSDLRHRAGEAWRDSDEKLRAETGS